MANKFQLKRTTVSGRTANTTNSSNSSFIDKGELAVNLADRKVFSSDSSNAIFEVGSNLSSLSVGSIVANGTVGTSGQVLSSNGSSIYWVDPSASSTNVNAQFVWTNTHVFTQTLVANGISISNNSAHDASLHLVGSTGGYNRFIQISPGANSVDILNIMASSNSTGGEQWWSWGIEQDVYKVQVGVGFGGAGFTANNIGWVSANGFSGNGASLTSVNAATVGGNSASDLRTYSDNKAANAYSNSVSYTDTKIGTANTAITGNAATAYTNATTFSANADNISSGTLNTARLPATVNVVTAINVSNTVSIVTGNVSISAGNDDSYFTGSRIVFEDNVTETGNVFFTKVTHDDIITQKTITSTNTADLGYISRSGFTAIDGLDQANTSNYTRAIIANTTSISIGNTTVKTTINSTAIVGNGSFITSVNAATVGGNTATTLRTYTDDKAANAYSNAVSYTDTKIGTANTAITGNAATAYTNAVSYTDTKIGTANTAITGNAATAYTNAVSYTDSKILTANGAITGNAATAYTNAVSYTDTKIGTANTAMAANAAAAYTNAVSYTDTKIGTANTAITGNAATAYTNATTFSANATNLTNGTVAEARLPYRMNQNVRTTDNVEFSSITVTGNLVVQGTTTTVNTVTLSVQDNMIYLNANSTVTNPDLGFAGNYNDGTYKHAGFFRDATDGYWKVFDSYTPEPDANAYIDIANTSFHIADFWANTARFGNTSVYSSINTTSFSGTANNSTNFGGLSLATVQGQITGNAATAYTNAVSYTDTKIGTANTAMEANAAAAYTNAVSYTDTKIGTANTAITGNAATAYTNATTFAANATNLTNGTIPYARIPANVINTTAAFTRTGITTFSANVVLDSSGLSANGGFGTAGHVLHSNGTATYWAADDNTTYDLLAVANTAVNAGLLRLTDSSASNDTVTFTGTGTANVSSNATHIIINSTDQYVGTVTSVATGNGLTGGSITATGTVSILANTGIVANSTGAFVNASYIATISANNATYLNGQLAAYYTNATNISTGTLAAARLPSLYLGTTTIQSTSAAQAVSGITTLAAGNTTITGFLTANNLFANGSSGHSIRTTTPGAAQGEKSAISMWGTFTGTADNGPRRVADIAAGYVGGAWTNETLTFHVGYGGANDNANTNIQRLLINATSFAANSLAFSGITTLAAGNTTITGFANASIALSVNSTFVANSTAVYATKVVDKDNGSFELNSDGTSYLTNLYLQNYLDCTGTADFSSNVTVYSTLTVTSTNQANLGILRVRSTSNFEANVALANNAITRPVLAGYTEHEVSNTAATGTWTMDCGAANFFDLTLTGNITISPTNVPPSTRVWSGSIAAKQDATGGRTITWPSGTKWPGGVAPPATTTANAIDIWSIMTYDGGTTWIASLSVKNAS